MLQPSTIASIVEPELGALRLGRDPSCEIHVDDGRCSRFHARLVVRRNPHARRGFQALIEDLGSTNGTWVNQERVAGKRALHIHDKVGVGDTLFAYLVLDGAELEATRAVIKAAMTDPLTGLLNRWTFEQEVEKELARARRYRWPLSLLMIDLDHFKRINDTYGHEGGDRVLCAVTKVIAESKRRSDLAGRHGGEEIVVALPQTDLATAQAVAERLRATIAGLRLPMAGERVCVTASIGIATWLDGAPSLAELIGAADAAMYRAKAEGRNRVAFVRPPTETR
jgi:diguanylate cyclase (GGDEF)-like protein